DLPAAFMPWLPPDELFEEVQQVVHDHEGEGCRDQEQVSPTDPLHHWVIRALGHLHMDGTDDEFGIGDAFVALSACFREIGGIDGGTRVARPENGVHPMA